MIRRWICTDVWMDILPNFNRPQLGFKMAILSSRFEVLVDKHFDGKREVPIWRSIIIRKDIVMPKLYVLFGYDSVPFPWPDRPLRNKIRFAKLWIDYIDHSVIAFLCANQQIWDKGINLHLIVSSHNNSNNYNNVQRILHVYVHAILPIFAPNIRHLIFSDGVNLDKLLHLTSPKMLFDLNIHSIYAGRLFPNAIDYGTLLLNEIGELEKPYSYYVGQALYKWLHIPTKDGKPKQLRCSTFTSEIIELINNFKEAFLRANTSSASYQIQFSVSAPTEIAPFQLVNERTNEMLTMEKGFRGYGSVDWLIKRCPIGGTTTALKWKDENLDDFNNVIIRLSGNCIGPLSPPAKEEEEAGQSSEKGASDRSLYIMIKRI